jgi:hypothetical protein
MNSALYRSEKGVELGEDDRGSVECRIDRAHQRQDAALFPVNGTKESYS